jgi:hypothetical protein
MTHIDEQEALKLIFTESKQMQKNMSELFMSSSAASQQQPTSYFGSL